MSGSRFLISCISSMRRVLIIALVICLQAGSVGNDSMRYSSPPLVKPALKTASSVDSEQVAPQVVPEGLTADEWASVKNQIRQHAYLVEHAETGYQANNPDQGWQIRFDGGGFMLHPQNGEWEWGLRLLGQPGSPSLYVQGNRVEYAWNADLTEWLVNDENGLEHGFLLQHRPSGTVHSLRLTMQVLGDLRPVVDDDRRGIAFKDRQGNALLRYAGLQVSDANGLPLVARLSIQADHLQVEVDDHNATYPITIDPLVQDAYLKAFPTETHTWDYFGSSVALSGDTLVVGAPYEDSNATGVDGNQANNLAIDSGAVYVFVRSGDWWYQQAYLKASNTDADDQFGSSLALSGDTLVVGAPDEAAMPP